MLKKISFGTASLGINQYGINPQQRSNSKMEQLEFILGSGVAHIDTAPIYGDSELIIGEYLAKNKIKGNIKISTKFSGIEKDHKNKHIEIRKSVFSSLKKLRTDCLDLLYVHQNDPKIFCDEQVISCLKNLKEDKLINETGVSIYTQDEFQMALSVDFYDWIQVPVNIFDISFLKFKPASSRVKIAARSIFLQGAIFCQDPVLNELPDGKYLRSLRKKILILCKEYDISIEHMAVSFVYMLEDVDNLILGSRSKPLWENMSNFIKPLPQELFNNLYQSAIESKCWTNPKLWKQV
jgi:aryl-alcohol dehydrogenase-like predicted oxidoreductase